jgi:A/G-specific adenine glycosylase
LAGEVVVGVGNIYASEALFMSGIRPTVKAHKLSAPRVAQLHAAIKQVLARAVAQGGSSLKDFVNAQGNTGYFSWKPRCTAERVCPAEFAAQPSNKLCKASALLFSVRHVKSIEDSPPLAETLVAWQKVHGRNHLPWQNTQDPYRVWLSEIMLQQTQVSTVLDYYDKFLQHFPTVLDLAAAPQDKVMGLWSGLGYYSRARNLHQCAQDVVSRFGGKFPSTAADLITLPGIGRSTAAAVASFCFSERVAIMDGNVKRVLTRVWAYDADLSISKHEKVLWQLAENALPTRHLKTAMPRYSQALMDLGATLWPAAQAQLSGLPCSK